MTDIETVRNVVPEGWYAVLQCATPSAGHDFAQLGGNSLRAVELIERLERRPGITFPIQTLFSDGTFDGVPNACLSAAADRVVIQPESRDA